jgi:hypothetical protein
VLRERGQMESVADQTFMFSKRALSKIFNAHSKAFEPVRFSRLRRSGNLIVEVRRRAIDHLIVVAGVACVGKSRFIDRLQASEDLRGRFGISKDKMTSVSAHGVDRLPSGRLGTVIFHYDILRPHGHSFFSFERDPAFHLIHSAKKVTVLTLVQSKEVIIQRSKTNDRPSRRRDALSAHYGKDGFLSGWYRAWSIAADPYWEEAGSRHFILADDSYAELNEAAVSLLP